MAQAALPALRDELTLHEGPIQKDGAKVWLIHDPVRNRYFQIPWLAVEILVHWDRGRIDEIVAQVNRSTSLEIDPEDVESLAKFLVNNQLTLAVLPTDTERLFEHVQRAKQNLFTWLMHHYLFFRIPLMRSDKFITRTYPLVKVLYSPAFFMLSLFALFVGLFLVSREWDVFVHSIIDMFSITGLFFYGLAYLCVKFFHELGHAYTVKRFGGRVPTMGVAFLVLWPMLYTDTNDAWTFKQRRQRVQVAAAGVMTEILIAAWATLAWSFLPVGPLKDVAFLLATVTWISSILINFSPFMRFDGYFLFMDWLGMPNLHARSFAYARWVVREALFDLGDEAPEYFSRRKGVFLFFFAIGTWLYRFFLFLGIAVLVYSFFIKAVGIILFIVEIYWFILKPIIAEIKGWHKRRAEILVKKRSFLTVIGLIIGGACLIMPWKTYITAPAVLKERHYSILYTQYSGQFDSLEVAKGQVIEKGDVIARLKSNDLENSYRAINNKIKLLEHRIQVGTAEERLSAELPVLYGRLQEALSARKGIMDQLAQLVIYAPHSGIVDEIDESFKIGHWVSAGTPLASVRTQGDMVIDAYVPEHEVHLLMDNAQALFYAEDLSVTPLAAVVDDIGRGAIENLPDLSLSSHYNGDILVREDNQALIPEVAQYRIRLSLRDDQMQSQIERRGIVKVEAVAQSLMTRFMRAAFVVFLRESGM